MSEDHGYATKVLWLIATWSLCIEPRDISYKKWNRFTAYPTSNTLTFSRRRTRWITRRRFLLLTLILVLVCAAQETPAEIDPSQVPRMSWYDRRSCLFECVCVCLCLYVRLLVCACDRDILVCMKDILYRYLGPCIYMSIISLSIKPSMYPLFYFLFIKEKNLTCYHSESYELSWSLLVLFSLFQKTLNSMLSTQIWIMISFHVIWQSRR